MTFYQRASILLVACCTTVAAHAQGGYEVRFFVRFENAKTGQPPSTAVPVDALRVRDEGKSALTVQLRSAEDLPIRLVVAYDTSGSGRRSGTIHSLRLSLGDFLNQVVRRGKDSVSLVNFSDDAYVDIGPTDDIAKVAERLKKTEEYRGGTALYDTIGAICKHVSKNGDPAQERRILLLFGDGDDNASRSDLKDAITAAQEAGVTIFAVSTGERGLTRSNTVLLQLANSTGGRVFAGIRPKEVDDFFGFLGRVLKAQFLITYTLAEPPKPGKHRSIEIVSSNPEVRAYASGMVVRH